MANKEYLEFQSWEHPEADLMCGPRIVQGSGGCC